MDKLSKTRTIVFFCGALFYIIWVSNKDSNEMDKKRAAFYNSQINGCIIGIKENFTKGITLDYLTQDGGSMTVNSSYGLKLGDSIVKQATSWQFNAYRKQRSGGYKFLLTKNLDNGQSLEN